MAQWTSSPMSLSLLSSISGFILYGLIPADAWSALLPVVNAVSTLELVDDLWDKISISRRSIFISAFDFGNRYLRFLAVETRRRPQRVRIRIIWPWDTKEILPDGDFVARLQVLTAQDLYVTVETSRGRENAQSNTNEDYDVFNPTKPLLPRGSRL
ncbi:hypothetical protein K438DRAFT_1786641 [Mycena galopus ATCC 62051]|nr:hypothetical protein K438DRAFT_1786641 [Mycena galopus ATCC 62051]